MARDVTKDEFYAEIYRRNLDVHPSPQAHVTYWKRRDGSTFATSSPGYMLEGPETYKIAEG